MRIYALFTRVGAGARNGLYGRESRTRIGRSNEERTVNVRERAVDTSTGSIC